MWIAIIALGLAALWMAHKAPTPPDMSQTDTPNPGMTGSNLQALGPNMAVPATGTVGNPSPASASGGPYISRKARLGLQLTAKAPGNAAQVSSRLVNPLLAGAGTFTPPSATTSINARSLMTNTRPALPGTSSGPMRRGTTIKI